MPLYEYKCDRCSAVFEVIQKFSDEPLSVHETCGGRVEKLLSRSAIQFKGSGWYITDYAKSGGGKGSSGGKDRDAAPAAESKAEKKGEASTASSAATPAASTATTTTSSDSAKK
ncbi:MAG: zinc ribbon domain-containing protein [Candidatus Solibacter usitatus]|nr:zinc ribbon domain-containing protein [Candidatus Solibacter usitatus]